MSVLKITRRTSLNADKTSFLWLLLFTAHLSNSSAFNERYLRPTLTPIRNSDKKVLPIPLHENIKYQLRFSSNTRQGDSFSTVGSCLNLSRSSPVSSLNNEFIASDESPQSEGNDSISRVDKLIVAGSIICAISSLVGLLAVSGTGCWRYFLAGGICAAVSHTIPTPVDVVKVSANLKCRKCGNIQRIVILISCSLCRQESRWIRS